MCVGEWQRGSLWISVCSHSLLVPAGHQTANVHHLMTIKIPSCLSLFLALLPSPLMCFKLHVWQPQPHSFFARMIHQCAIQTLYFWSLPYNNRGKMYKSNLKCLIIPQKKVFVGICSFDYKRKEEVYSQLLLNCGGMYLAMQHGNRESDLYILFIQSVLPFFRSLFLLLSLYLFKVPVGVHWCWTYAVYGFLLRHCID